MPDDGNDGEERYTLYARRWYLVAVFSLMSCLQCCVWGTYGPISSCVARDDVYGWGKGVQPVKVPRNT